MWISIVWVNQIKPKVSVPWQCTSVNEAIICFKQFYKISKNFIRDIRKIVSDQ